MSIPLPPEFERAVLERVRSGRYPTTEEVLLACLGALERAEAEDEARHERLLVDLDEGIDELDRGEGIDGPTAIAQARAEFLRRVGA